MWVSSELQYSDGLTKASAAQLLADRLRSHLTRLKSDEDFVASKEKVSSRKKERHREVCNSKTSKNGNSDYVCSLLHFSSRCNGL